MAAQRPNRRRRLASVLAACAILSRIVSVKPASSKPSIAKTRPIAAEKSRILLGRLTRRRRRFRLRRRRRRRRGEIAEEIRFRTEHEARVAGFERRLIGLHRAVEGEEVRVLAIGFGEDAVALGVALAANLLGFLLRLGDRHRDLAIGFGLDLLALLRALRAKGRRPL